MSDPDRDILILLSTHNGADHIGEQLDSLRRQTLVDRIHVLIRDDGSTDATIDAIRSSDTTGLSVDLVPGQATGGAKQAFTTLMQMAPSNAAIIMLCDQDDVWRPDKVAHAVAGLADAACDRPCLYVGRSIITDENLNPTGVTDEFPDMLSLHDALFHNTAPGHTMAFNQALLREYRTTVRQDSIMHDWWLYLLAISLGSVVTDPVPHALYRQHDRNEVGYASSPLARLGRRWRRLLHEDRTIVTRQAEALWQAIGPRLSGADADVLRRLLDQRTASARLGFLRRYPLVNSNGGPAIVSSILFLLGCYRLR